MYGIRKKSGKFLAVLLMVAMLVQFAPMPVFADFELCVDCGFYYWECVCGGVEYQVVFDANGAAGSAPASMTVSAGVEIEIPEPGDMTREGYIFYGWYSEDVDVGTLMPGEQYVVEGDIEFTAVWLKGWAAYAVDAAEDTDYFINNEGSVYTVSTAKGLAWIALQVNYHHYDFLGDIVQLGEDIDLTGKEWLPIGMRPEISFRGTFDGENKVITGLSIGTQAHPDDTLLAAGLFGFVDCQAIKNVGIKSGSIYSTSSLTGMLAGQAYVSDKIVNCYAEGSITVNYGGETVGGLIGELTGGCETSSTTVDRCYSAVDIFSTESYLVIGGLIGEYFSPSSDYGIINSYATGNITSGSSSISGGLVGRLYGSGNYNIINCFATGNVTSGINSDIGGIVGNSQGQVINSYSTGNLTGGADSNIGGVIGYSEHGGIVNGYWNSDGVHTLNGSVLAPDAKKGVGGPPDDNSAVTDKTSNEMKEAAFAQLLNANQSSISELPLGTALIEWGLDQDKNNGYPVLVGIGEGSGVVSAGGGSSGGGGGSGEGGDPGEGGGSGEGGDAADIAAAKAALDETDFTFGGTDDKDNVTQNFTLPLTGSNGTAIAWSVTSGGAFASIDNDTGVVTVTRPDYLAGEETVTLTATISKGGQSDTKTLTVKVLDLRPEAPSTGDGSENNPFLIASPWNLLWLSEQVNSGANLINDKYFKQTADIDMGGVGSFTPIGLEDSDKRFKGTYDGDDYKISSLVISASVTLSDHGSLYYGLFGYMEGATVKNVVLEDVAIDIKLGQSHTTRVTFGYIGGLAGFSSESAIFNCRVLATQPGGSVIKAASQGGRTEFYVGGIVGYAEIGSNAIQKAVNQADITGVFSNDRENYIGGIAGFLSVYPSADGILNSCNTGNISLSGDMRQYQRNTVGGIVGHTNRASIKNNLNTGTVSDTSVLAEDAEKRTGGIAGNAGSNATFSNNFYLATSAAIGIGRFGSAGPSDVNAEPKTEAQLKTPSTYSGWNPNIWLLVSGSFPTLHPGPFYTVTYDGNGSDGGTVPADSNEYPQGATVTVSGNTGSLTKTGLTFSGWNTQADGKGTDYAAGATFTMGTANITLYAKWTAPTPPAPESQPDPTPAPAPGIPIMLNGQTQQQAAAVSTQNQDGKTVIIVTPETQSTITLVNASSIGSTITVPVNNAAADAVVGQLSGDLVKAMENREAVLEIKTNNASYTLPARQINIDAVLAQLGQDVKLSDVRLHIEIANATGGMAKVVEDSAVKGNFAIVVPPLSFTVKATYGDKTLNISRFDSYVARTVAIPDGVDPSKITTGIVVEPDGTVRHVPTQIIVIDGKYYARINSLTNSTYSVIWNPVKFQDVEGHWAKEAVNDMGSRLVISGIGNNMFVPDRDITRAEFAAIMVRALGLKAGTGANPFTDVSCTAWYCDSIKTAAEYKLISGYGDGRFGPSDKLTREQAMAIIARAMNITGLKAELASGEAEKLLAGFTDAAKAADYARNSIAACLKAGIVSGRGGNLIAPKDNITRAEVAAIVQRLLQKSGLI